MDKSDKVLYLLENSFKKLDKSIVSTLTAQIGKCIEDVGTKIEKLLSSQSALQEEINSFAKSVKDPPVPLCTVDVEANPVAACVSCTLADELAKRDKRKRTL